MFDEESIRDSFIYVGRLHSEKKPLLLIEAFEQLLAVRSGLRLVIVGAGPLSEQLKRKVETSPAADSVLILGHVEDYSVLKTLYSSAIASISPGYVGLSVTQSLSFGVPMIISRAEPHAPEIEAVEDGSNCIYFRTDDVHDLSQKMKQMVDDRQAWRAKGAEISNACGSSYSVEAMVSGLVDALEDRSS
ncbi:glycosyltransferase [Arthrobacter sp. NPDC080073]|uniref:glycosyltransferase family 4 protein n=1 Tax=Arthrobacter sp. NPDC080073 TaxID=3155919 RepID=UPI003424EC4B